MIQKILQDINRCYKNSRKMYFDKLISESKNTTKTTWKIIKKELFLFNKAEEHCTLDACHVCAMCVSIYCVV